MNNTDAQNKAIHAGAKTKALKGKTKSWEQAKNEHHEVKLGEARHQTLSGKKVKY